jgi:hypothetical protein
LTYYTVIVKNRFMNRQWLLIMTALLSISSAQAFTSTDIESASGFISVPAHRGHKLNAHNLSPEKAAEVRSVVNHQIKDDLTAHFEDRVGSVTVPPGKDPPISPETRTVLLKGAFETLSILSSVPLNEAAFDKNIGRAMDWLAAHHLTPAGINIAALGRKTMGDGITAGVNYGAEMNFYFQDGKLMMTNYKLMGGQVGVGTPVSDIEYSVAFCFGDCYGGERTGWYVGVDADVAGGLGAGFYAEVDVDVSSLYEDLGKDRHLSVSDIYEASTFYIGFGITMGIGAESALGVYRYSQIGEDTVLANPGETLMPSMISKEAFALKH